MVAGAECISLWRMSLRPRYRARMIKGITKRSMDLDIDQAWRDIAPVNSDGFDAAADGVAVGNGDNLAASTITGLLAAM